MNTDDINLKVRNILSAILQIPVDDSLNRNNTAEWDSLKHMQIIFTLEEEFNVQLSEEDMAKLSSVADIISYVGAIHGC